MFDANTVALMQSAPQLDGLDLARLPERLTDAYVSIVTARVRMRELAAEDSLPPDIAALAAEMKRLAFTNEALVSAIPDRADKAAAAFVAGAAHHASLMAESLADPGERESRVTYDSIAPEVAATLLLLIAEASADAAEMAKRIVVPVDSPVEGRLLNAVVNLAKGELGAVAELNLPVVQWEEEQVASDSGLTGLLLLMLRGICKLARELLGTLRPSDVASTASSDFAAIKLLCVEPLDLGVQFGQAVVFSTFPGAHHLASLLQSAADSLAPSAIINVKPPAGVDGARWAVLMRKIATRRPFLWRNHRAAIDSGYLEFGTSAAISFPTGAGKSTLSELKIGATLLRGKKVIFLAPTLALVDQTAGALRATFPEASIQQERGDALSFEDLFEELPSVAVMTTERCLALLGYEPEAFSEVGLLVFDECHLLHAAEVSASHRPIDAMLCVLNFVAISPAADLLLLSAMMKNTGEIANWVASMTKRPCRALDLTWKPTRQARGCVVYEADAIEALNKALLQAKAVAITKGVPTAVAREMKAQPLGLFSLKQTWLSKARADYSLLPLLNEAVQLGTAKSPSGKYWYLTPSGNKLAAAVAVAAAQQKLKTLVFVQTIPLANAATHDVNRTAGAEAISLSAGEGSLLAEAIEELGANSCSYISMDASGKVASVAVCHHGLLIPAERQLHESLFRRTDGARVMIATSTLAQGMNLPSEVVIIGGDSRFDAGANRVQQLEAHELLNAAGRAGRAGESSYGFVLVIPSKIVHFRDGKNEIGRHWTDLQTIFGQSDQCLAIDDPITSLLDELHLAAEQRSSSLRYFLNRLPVGEGEDRDAPARDLLRNSFAAFRKRSSNDQTWVEDRIQAALAARAGQSAKATSWVERLAAATGVPASHLADLGQALANVELPNGGSITQWRDWYLSVLGQQAHFVPQLLRPSTLEGVLGKAYQELGDDAERGRYVLEYAAKPLSLWMRGATLAEIEVALGTKPEKLGRCDAARDFVLRMVPELAFILGLPAQVVRAIRKGTDQESALLGAGLSLLSACVRGGFDEVEKLALRNAAATRTARVSVHRRYASLKPLIAPAKGAEDLSMVVARVRSALAN